jgi:hypothetical protein
VAVTGAVAVTVTEGVAVAVTGTVAESVTESVAVSASEDSTIHLTGLKGVGVFVLNVLYHTVV